MPNHIYNHVSTTGFWAEPDEVTELLTRWRDTLSGGPQAGSSDTPTNKGQGSG